MDKKCAVPDCNKDAICKADISINNEPVKLLPVCQMHFESTLEDIKELINILKQKKGV